METKQKSEIELAVDALIDKFYQQLKTATPTLNRLKYQSTQCAIQAQQMVIDALEDVFEKSRIKISKHVIESFSNAKAIHSAKAILTELKSRL